MAANDFPMAGWLDLDERDQRRARNCLRRLEIPGSIDELGFGILRDAFADRFFPATNTIMTSTRYLFFIGNIYIWLEHANVRSDQLVSKLKSMQDQLREQLECNEQQNVIGKVSKNNLERYPHSIYWNGLKQLGFFQQDWDQPYYHRHLAQIVRARRGISDDDDMSHSAGPAARTWDPIFETLMMEGQSAINRKDGSFSDATCFQLHRAEARYLANRFKAIAEQRPSMLNHLVQERFDSEFSYPWETPVPPALKNVLHHARMVSVFTKGATLMYYHLLLLARRRARMSAPDLDFAAILERWWSLARIELLSWNLSEFFDLAVAMGALRNDRAFFGDWIERCKAVANAEALLNDTQATELIRRRELNRKGPKARFFYPEHLRRWNPPEHLNSAAYREDEHVPYWFDYRSGIGGTFVRDIVEGLERRGN